jgi:hypothetical protein
VRHIHRPGIFLVVWVDHEAETVDLVRVDAEPETSLVEGVPFTELLPFEEFGRQ